MVEPAGPSAVTPEVLHAYRPTASLAPVQFRPPKVPAGANTVAVWLIAVLPAILLITVLALIFVLDDFGTFMQAAVGLVFFLGAAVLATRDKRALLATGHVAAASPWWLLLSPLAYLIARTVCAHRQSLRASGPLWTYLVLSALPLATTVFLVLETSSILQVVRLAAAR